MREELITNIKVETVSFYSKLIDNRGIYSSSFNAGLRPEPELKVSEWADQYRMLSQIASAEAGMWRTERTPYLQRNNGYFIAIVTS